jgi:hypothetical protein
MSIINIFLFQQTVFSVVLFRAHFSVPLHKESKPMYFPCLYCFIPTHLGKYLNIYIVSLLKFLIHLCVCLLSKLTVKETAGGSMGSFYTG